MKTSRVIHVDLKGNVKDHVKKAPSFLSAAVCNAKSEFWSSLWSHLGKQEGQVCGMWSLVDTRWRSLYYSWGSNQAQDPNHMLLSLICPLLPLSVFTVWITPPYLVRSPLLLGFHFCQEAAAHHLQPRVPPSSLRTAPAVWPLPGLIYGVWRPQLLWTVRAAAVVRVLRAAGGISAVKTGVISESGATCELRLT